jgi:hypothetical protein
MEVAYGTCARFGHRRVDLQKCLFSLNVKTDFKFGVFPSKVVYKKVEVDVILVNPEAPKSANAQVGVFPDLFCSNLFYRLAIATVHQMKAGISPTKALA